MTPDILPPALLLDLDDTILDDSAGADACWAQVAARYAPSMAPRSADDFLASIQGARDRFWNDPERNRVGRMNLQAARRVIVAEALTALDVKEIGALAGRIATDYASLRKAMMMEPLPGALDALARLKAHGVRMGLITNGDAAGQRRKIELFALSAFFEVIVIEGEFGCGKPDARVYHHALGALQVDPASAWMAGDNLEFDVLAPQRLGITGIWVNSTGRALPPDAAERPSRIIRALAELV